MMGTQEYIYFHHPPPKAHHSYLTLEMLNWGLVGHATGLD
jgi:hypothetical protein